MRMHRLLLMAVAITACDLYNRPCYETRGVTCRPPTEPCEAADDGTGGEAECSLFEEPEIFGETVECGQGLSEIEVMGDDAAGQYGVTDYAFESGSTSLAGLLDFQPIPVPFDGVSNPWVGYLRAALPGVVTHKGNGGVLYAGYFSRVCCSQSVVNGSLSGWPENPTCAKSGYTINHVPNAWCLEMDKGVGLCVYPCDSSSDCPEPATEFCDFDVPDPNGNGLGVCRYKSMPSVPTAHEDINP